MSNLFIFKLIIPTIACTFLVLLFFDEKVVKLIPPDYDSILKTDSTPFFESDILKDKTRSKNESGILLDFCELPVLDPWDPLIARYLDPNKRPFKYCKQKLKLLSELKDGILTITHEDSEDLCYHRCLLPVSDYKLNETKWIRYANESRPLCDVVEVVCTNSTIEDFKNPKSMDLFYHFLHAQTYRKGFNEPSPRTTQNPFDKVLKPTKIKPDVHFIIFDSVSVSQFVRSMPKTRHVLREYYDAISFRHLNKVALNSRPNGFALLLGKTMRAIKKSVISRGHKADYQKETECKKPLDNDQFIGYRFQDDGYVTMMSEDWALGVFNWPNCMGFNATPTDHYMKPFQLRVEGKYKSLKLALNLHSFLCRETYYYQIEYLKDFLHKYPDKPKFSISWMTYLAHDDINNLYHADDYFYHFFKDHQEQFRNSYLFIMGDHGLRFGSARKTVVGEIEDNNPFLFLSLPDNVKSDLTLVNQIKLNAKHELVTHYDIYATLLNITNPSNPRIKDPIIKGSPLFYPLPEPRTCDRLLIPYDYCPCKKNTTRLSKNYPKSVTAVQKMVKIMNEKLNSEEKTSKLCSKLSLSKSAPVITDEYDTRSKIRLYRVEFRTVPGNGNFWSFYVENLNGELEITSELFPRLDSYDEQAKCAKGTKYVQYCYCKN